MTYDIMIVAAGNGSRMGADSLPKVLISIDGRPNLWNTFDKLTEIEESIGNIYLVVSNRNSKIIQQYVDDYKADLKYFTKKIKIINRVQLVEIESGQGDGHAVMKAAYHLPLSSFFFVVWGDAYFTSSNIFSDCINEYIRHEGMGYAMYIPVINEKNPYVTFIVDERMECVAADFSKRGENHPSGFHDQCVFLCKRSTVCELLSVMHNAYLKNSRYVTDSGELTFLYLVHFLHNVSNPAKALVTESPVLSYNTMGEVKQIEESLSEEA